MFYFLMSFKEMCSIKWQKNCLQLHAIQFSVSDILREIMHCFKNDK